MVGSQNYLLYSTQILQQKSLNRRICLQTAKIYSGESQAIGFIGE
jgi:hypothetical protein